MKKRLNKTIWVALASVVLVVAARWVGSVNLSTEFVWFLFAAAIPTGFIWVVIYLASPDSPRRENSSLPDDKQLIDLKKYPWLGKMLKSALFKRVLIYLFIVLAILDIAVSSASNSYEQNVALAWSIFPLIIFVLPAIVIIELALRKKNKNQKISKDLEL